MAKRSRSASSGQSEARSKFITGKLCQLTTSQSRTKGASWSPKESDRLTMIALCTCTTIPTR